MEEQRPFLEMVDKAVYRPYLDNLFDSLLDRSKWCPLMNEFIRLLKKPVWEIWYDSYEHADYELIGGGQDVINLFMNPSRRDELLVYIQQSVRGRLFAMPTSLEQMDGLAASKGMCFGDFMRTLTVQGKEAECGSGKFWAIHKTTGHMLYHYFQAGFADYINVNWLFDQWNEFFRPFELVPFTFSDRIDRTDYSRTYELTTTAHPLHSMELNIREGSISNPQISFDYVDDEDGDAHRVEIIGHRDSLLDFGGYLIMRSERRQHVFHPVFTAQRKMIIDDILETI